MPRCCEGILKLRLKEIKLQRLSSDFGFWIQDSGFDCEDLDACVQDPVARTVSSHNMMYQDSTRCWGKVCSEQPDPLLEEFRKHRDLQFKWPEDLTGCNFNKEVCSLALNKLKLNPKATASWAVVAKLKGIKPIRLPARYS
jgi:hypothetical protein